MRANDEIGDDAFHRDRRGTGLAGNGRPGNGCGQCVTRFLFRPAGARCQLAAVFATDLLNLGPVVRNLVEQPSGSVGIHLKAAVQGREPFDSWSWGPRALTVALVALATPLTDTVTVSFSRPDRLSWALADFDSFSVSVEVPAD